MAEQIPGTSSKACGVLPVFNWRNIPVPQFDSEAYHVQKIQQRAGLLSGDYKIEAREVVAKVKELRASILTVGPGQCVPWHHHSEVTDTVFCIEGPMQVETRTPDEARILAPGDTTVITPGQPHRVSGVDGGRCKFLIIQGVGNYDFIPEADARAALDALDSK